MRHWVFSVLGVSVFLPRVTVTALLLLALFTDSGSIRNGPLQTKPGSDHFFGPRAASALLLGEISTRYARLPLSFEPNLGQAPPDVQFIARGAKYALHLGQTTAHLALRDETAQLTVMPVAANPQARAVGDAALPGVVNYFLGNDPVHWQRDIPTYERVRVDDVYRGIDLVYYGTQGQLEYDFVVAPGSDPSQIKVRLAGATSLAVDADGELVVRIGRGELRQLRPLAFQTRSGVRVPVAADFAIDGSDTYRFTLGEYDPTLPLVIDPVLAYSTYLGDSVTFGNGIAVDAAGYVYVTGSTTNSSFPSVGGLPSGWRGGVSDAFITKITPAGDAIVYSTFVGGTTGGATGFGGSDSGKSLAVDAAGQVHLIGYTHASDFPIVNAFQPFTPTAPGVDRQVDVFVTKLNGAGNAIVFSTYLGGLLQDLPGDIALDAAGNVYAFGDTISTDFPVLNALQSSKKADSDESTFSKRPDFFITKLSPTGNGIYSTYLGGLLHDFAKGAEVDADGNLVVVGSGDSSDYPQVNPYQPCTAGGGTFISKLNPAGTQLLYSTCFGGSGNIAESMALDAAGHVYIGGGATTPGTLPVTAGAFQTTFGGSSYDIFVAKLNITTNVLVYATYIGGGGSERAFGIDVDATGAAYVGGYTDGATFPAVNAIQPTPGGVGFQSVDGVVSKLAPDGSALLYSTYLGGDSTFGEQVFAIAVDGAGNAVVTGVTDGGTFPITPNAIQPTKNGQRVAFVAKILSGNSGLCAPVFGSPGAAIGPSGGTGSLSIVAFDSQCAWSVTSSHPWVIFTTPASGTGIGTIGYTTELNQGPSRVATLTSPGVSAPYLVQQQGQPGLCTFAVSPQQSVPASGGSLTFNVTATAGCEWAALSQSSFVTVGQPAWGTGVGSFSVMVSTNPSTSSRVGFILVGNTSTSVSQSAGPAGCSYSLASSSASIPGTSSSNSVALTTTAGCPWTASSNVPWLSITSPASGTGASTIQFAAQSNPLSVPRVGTLSIGGLTFTVTQGGRARGDFDGDGKTDVTVFRPSSVAWYVLRSATGTATGTFWGITGDVPVPGDYDGDGKTDFAVYRPSSSAWYALLSTTGSGVGIIWGIAGDVPVPADYDGDGYTDVAIYRPSTAVWYIIPSGTNVAYGVYWGVSGDVPIPADFDGDGKADPTVFRPSTSAWYQLRSTTGAGFAVVWGTTGDMPLAGDYDGDGKADPTVFRPSSGTWYQLRSTDGAWFGGYWGVAGDVPIVGDYDGDGKADLTVFRPSTSTWYQLRSQTGTGFAIVWGIVGDHPM
jgi:hypothetical protein